MKYNPFKGEFTVQDKLTRGGHLKSHKKISKNSWNASRTRPGSQKLFKYSNLKYEPLKQSQAREFLHFEQPYTLRNWVYINNVLLHDDISNCFHKYLHAETTILRLDHANFNLLVKRELRHIELISLLLTYCLSSWYTTTELKSWVGLIEKQILNWGFPSISSTDVGFDRLVIGNQQIRKTVHCLLTLFFNNFKDIKIKFNYSGLPESFVDFCRFLDAFNLRYEMLCAQYKKFYLFHFISGSSINIICEFFLFMNWGSALFNHEKSGLYLHQDTMEATNKFILWAVYYTGDRAGLKRLYWKLGQPFVDRPNKQRSLSVFNQKNLVHPSISLRELLKTRYKNVLPIQRVFERDKLLKSKPTKFYWVNIHKKLIWYPSEKKVLRVWKKPHFFFTKENYDLMGDAYYNEFRPLFLKLKAKLFIDNFAKRSRLVLFSYYERFQVARISKIKKNLFPSAFWIRCTRMDLVLYLLHYYVEGIPLAWFKENKTFLNQLVHEKLLTIKSRYTKKVNPRRILATYLYNAIFSTQPSLLPCVFAFQIFFRTEATDKHFGETYNFRVFLYALVTDDFVKKNITDCFMLLRLSYTSRGKVVRVFRTMDKFLEHYYGGISEWYAGHLVRRARFLLVNCLYEDIMRYMVLDNRNVFSRYTNFGKLGVPSLYQEDRLNSKLKAYGLDFSRHPLRQHHDWSVTNLDFILDQ